EYVHFKNNLDVCERCGKRGEGRESGMPLRPSPCENDALSTSYAHVSYHILPFGKCFTERSRAVIGSVRSPIAP
ncbi:MAG: hypothetical protein ACLU0V_08945, partial [Eggerthella lenta]